MKVLKTLDIRNHGLTLLFMSLNIITANMNVPQYFTKTSEYNIWTKLDRGSELGKLIKYNKSNFLFLGKKKQWKTNMTSLYEVSKKKYLYKLINIILFENKYSFNIYTLWKFCCPNTNPFVFKKTFSEKNWVLSCNHNHHVKHPLLSEKTKVKTSTRVL